MKVEMRLLVTLSESQVAAVSREMELGGTPSAAAIALWCQSMLQRWLLRGTGETCPAIEVMDAKNVPVLDAHAAPLVKIGRVHGGVPHVDVAPPGALHELEPGLASRAVFAEADVLIVALRNLRERAYEVFLSSGKTLIFKTSSLRGGEMIFETPLFFHKGAAIDLDIFDGVVELLGHIVAPDSRGAAIARAQGNIFGGPS